MRPLSYPQTDIFIVTFSVTDPTSFQNVRSKWVPELKRCAPNVPFILVGTKIDTRKGIEHVSKANGDRLCVELKGLKYLECSAKTQDGLKEVFDFAIQYVSSFRKTQSQKTKRRKCLIS